MANIDKFIYVHILKTAGTTLRHTLFERHFKGRYLYDSTFKPKLNKLVEKPDHPAIIDPQPYPKNYEKYDVIFGHFKHDKYSHLNRPMFSFVRNPVDRLVNQYFYHKGFYERKGVEISLIDFAEMWKNHMSYVLGDIDQYTFIGAVSQFEKSINKMCDVMGVSRPKKIISRSLYGDDEMDNVPKETLRKIAEINSDDMELYQKVLDKI